MRILEDIRTEYRHAVAVRPVRGIATPEYRAAAQRAAELLDEMRRVRDYYLETGALPSEID